MEILYQTEVMGDKVPWLLFATLSFSIILFIVVLFTDLAVIHIRVTLMLCCVACFMLIISIVQAGLYSGKLPTGRYRYEVLLDDDMSCNDIYDKYKVIERS